MASLAMHASSQRMQREEILNESKFLTHVHSNDTRASCCRIRRCVANHNSGVDNDFQP
jgi:hypothetical protein